MNHPGAAESADPEQIRIRPYLRAGPARAAGTARSGQPAPAGSPPDQPAPLTPIRPRPFVLTWGRVRPADPDIGLETQVTATLAGPDSPPVTSLAPQSQAILALASEPISVAELSARIPLHLGVAKVLVGDLRVAGYLDVHCADVADPTDPQLILRVIRGLRALA